MSDMSCIDGLQLSVPLLASMVTLWFSPRVGAALDCSQDIGWAPVSVFVARAKLHRCRRFVEAGQAQLRQGMVH